MRALASAVRRNAAGATRTAARAGGAYLNADKIPLEELGDKLRRVFAARNEYMLFFAAEDDVPFGEAMKIMDAARGGGALTIAVVTDPPKPSP